MFCTTMNYSKELSSFSEFPPPKSFSNFMHHSEVMEYLRLYVEYFELEQYFRLGQKVTGIKRAENWQEDGLWEVEVLNM